MNYVASFEKEPSWFKKLLIKIKVAIAKALIWLSEKLMSFSQEEPFVFVTIPEFEQVKPFSQEVIEQKTFNIIKLLPLGRKEQNDTPLYTAREFEENFFKVEKIRIKLSCSPDFKVPVYPYVTALARKKTIRDLIRLRLKDLSHFDALVSFQIYRIAGNASEVLYYEKNLYKKHSEEIYPLQPEGGEFVVYKKVFKKATNNLLNISIFDYLEIMKHNSNILKPFKHYEMDYVEIEVE